MTDKIDLKKALDGYRAKPSQFQLVDLPPRRYLMVDGSGDPNTSRSYAAALEALYPVAYALKFESKRELGRDYVVPPLEGLWWADDMSTFTSARDKSMWSWTMMLLIPEWVPDAAAGDVIERVRTERAPARIDDVRSSVLAEGLCVQALHRGSFDGEGPVLARMHEEFIPQNGLRMTGRHHEVYLSDPRRTAPDRLRTILRQPVEPG